MWAKLNPKTVTVSGATTPIAKVNFPGFQKILDFTSAGSESSVAVTVSGDTDKEYQVLIDNTNSSQIVNVRLNNDTTLYGQQYILNNAGTITSARATPAQLYSVNVLGLTTATILTPTGFVKTAFVQTGVYTTGTTVSIEEILGCVYNSTASTTSLNFVAFVGNFTAGTRIVVYARRTYP